jgi:hypothetical protein
MADLHITPSSLRAASAGLSAVVDRLANALTQLESDAAAVGQPWGTGLVGTVFGDIYEGIREMALGSYEQNGDVMSDYADALDFVADTMEKFENDAAGDLELVEADLARRFRP